MPIGASRLNTLSAAGGEATFAVAAAGGATSVNEGSSLTFNVTGTNITNGTYYFTVTNAGDFATSSGSFTITSNAGSFSVTPTADVTTEGAETFTASVRTGSISGTVVATSASITINDTSLSASYAVAAAGGATSVNEGATLSFNVTGSGIADGTYYWTVTNSGDFATSSGSFSITSNAGSFTVGPTADGTTEGAETFQAQVRTVSTSGTIVATSASITINDTSINGWRLLEKTSDTNAGYFLLGIDTSENIYVSQPNISGGGYSVFKFNRAGVRQEHYNPPTTGHWPSFYPGWGALSSSLCVLSGKSTNLVATSANTGSPEGSTSVGWISFSSSIATITAQKYFGRASADQPRSIDMDASGNTYISWADFSNTNGCAAWAKIDSTGAILNSGARQRTGTSTTTGFIGSGGICVDDSDNIYHSGYFGSTGTSQWIAKFNSSGTYQSMWGFNDAIAYTRSDVKHYGGFIYLLLTTSGQASKVYKFNTSGTFQWVRSISFGYVQSWAVGANGILWQANNGGIQFKWGIMNLDGTAGNSWGSVPGSAVLNGGGVAWAPSGKIVCAFGMYRSSTANDHYGLILSHTTSQPTQGTFQISGGSNYYSIGADGAMSISTPSTPTFNTTVRGSNSSFTPSTGNSAFTMTNAAAAADSVKINLA